MHRFIVFVALAVTSAMALDRECMKLGGPHAFMCCKSMPKPPPRDDSLKECFEGLPHPPPPPPPSAGPPAGPPPGPPPPPPSCKVDICIAQKKGFANEDGVIDKEAMYADLEKQFGEDKAAKFKKNCLDATDISEYGPPGVCDLMKIKHCVHVTSAASCTEWNDEDRCKEFKELAEKCAV